MIKKFGIWLITIAVLCVPACSKPATPTPPKAVAKPTLTVAPPPAAGAGEFVAASVVIRPVQYADLSFLRAGVVAEIKVNVGDRVRAGDVLAQLDTAALELARQVAQQEVLAQQADLDQAVAENAQQIAAAGVALQVAQLQLEQSKTQSQTPVVAAAQARVKELEFQISQNRAQDPAPQVTMAQVELTQAQSVRDAARTEYDEALNRPWESQEVRDGYAYALQQAEIDLQLAQAQFSSAQAAQQAHSIGLNVLAAQLETAQAELEQALNARQAYSITLDILTTLVETAQLELADLQTQQALYQGQGPTATQALLKQAELAVAQIELQIQEAQLRAPFDGTIVAIRIRPAETVVERQAAILLADLEHLSLETTDLSQFAVARVRVGQPATVQLDAFPGVSLTGRVDEIAWQETIQEGQVTFAVRVNLDDPAALPGEIRWGMTGLARIHVDSP